MGKLRGNRLFSAVAHKQALLLMGPGSILAQFTAPVSDGSLVTIYHPQRHMLGRPFDEADALWPVSRPEQAHTEAG